MQVSSAEQEVSCSSSSSPQNHYEMLRELLAGSSLTDSDRIRLLLLYALRYETDGRSQVLQCLLVPDSSFCLLFFVLTTTCGDET